MRKIHSSAWLLVACSAALQVVIFPLLRLYGLSWIAVAPMLLAILRARVPETLHLEGQERLLPATPGQGFALGCVCGALWIAGSCYWIVDTMRQYGGLPAPAAVLVLLLFCLWVGVYHGIFGTLLAIVAGSSSTGLGRSTRRALTAAPFLWVAVELARTRITAVPWQLLGYSQTGNFGLTRIASLTGVYGLSFEVLLVNSVFAAAFLVPRDAPREKRNWLLAAACSVAVILQAGQLLEPPRTFGDRTAILVQPNIPIQATWTKDYFQSTLRELTAVSLHPQGRAGGNSAADFIVWPETPSPFYINDPLFRDAVSELARKSGAWVVSGAIGVNPDRLSNGNASQMFNSAALVSPSGGWVGRYDKVHLVPFGEYLPFPRLFAFADGLTKEVGEFTRGAARMPLDTDRERLGLFICYESIFPDEVRQFPLQGAQVLVNISNDGWYGDSGAWREHLQETQMRAIENGSWLLASTNTGITGSIDPYGRIVVATERKVRTGLVVPFALAASATFYTRHGDWFAYLCAIISVGAIMTRYVLPIRER